MIKFFKKKEEKESNWKDDIIKLASEGKILNSSIKTEALRCGTCQEPLGKGIFKGLIICDSKNEVYELYFHDLESCWNYEKIQEDISAKGHEIISSAQTSNLKSSDENLKSFLRDSLDLDR